HRAVAALGQRHAGMRRGRRRRGRRGRPCGRRRASGAGAGQPAAFAVRARPRHGRRADADHPGRVQPGCERRATGRRRGGSRLTSVRHRTQAQTKKKPEQQEMNLLKKMPLSVQLYLLVGLVMAIMGTAVALTVMELRTNSKVLSYTVANRMVPIQDLN